MDGSSLVQEASDAREELLGARGSAELQLVPIGRAEQACPFCGEPVGAAPGAGRPRLACLRPACRRALSLEHDRARRRREGRAQRWLSATSAEVCPRCCYERWLCRCGPVPRTQRP